MEYLPYSSRYVQVSLIESTAPGGIRLTLAFYPQSLEAIKLREIPAVIKGIEKENIKCRYTTFT